MTEVESPSRDSARKSSLDRQLDRSTKIGDTNNPAKETYWRENLFKAARKNDIKEVEKCLNNGCPIDLQEADTNDTILLIACQKGYMELLQKCIDRHGNVNPHPEVGYNGLQISVMNGRMDCCQMIFSKVDEYEEFVNLPDPEGDYPVHACAERGYLEIMKLLNKYKADMKVTNNRGRTPLHLARAQGHYCIYLLLLLLYSNGTIHYSSSWNFTDKY